MDTASQGISGQPCRNTTAHRLSAGPQAAVCLPMHPDFPAQGNLMPPNVKNYKNYKERAHYVFYSFVFCANYTPAHVSRSFLVGNRCIVGPVNYTPTVHRFDADKTTRHLDKTTKHLVSRKCLPVSQSTPSDRKKVGKTSSYYASYRSEKLFTRSTAKISSCVSAHSCEGLGPRMLHQPLTVHSTRIRWLKFTIHGAWLVYS